MKVKVNGFGPSFVVEINKTATVESLKKKIEETTGLPPEQQRVLGGGKEFADGHHLFQYQLPDECFVFLTKRCPPTKDEESPVKDEEPPVSSHFQFESNILLALHI